MKEIHSRTPFFFISAPTSPPRDIVAYGTADDSFYAGWKEPLEANGLIEGYYLYFCRDRNLPLDKWWKRAYASNSTTIVGLPAHRTSYYIKILALNAKGPGPLSKVYVVKTIKGGKCAVKSVGARCSLRRWSLKSL